MASVHHDPHEPTYNLRMSAKMQKASMHMRVRTMERYDGAPSSRFAQKDEKRKEGSEQAPSPPARG